MRGVVNEGFYCIEDYECMEYIPTNSVHASHANMFDNRKRLMPER